MDKLNYPVVDERVLAPVAPKKFFGKGIRRSASEVPIPMAGHCLVYRTRGQYTLDSSNLPLDSPTVVEATHVSVVDTTANTEVQVEVPLPSKDGSLFTMRVAFLCSVDDPVEVVSAGGQSAVHALTGYLRGHQRLFEIGLDFAIDDINEVRRKLSAQVHAYATLSPPVLRGMTASLASVEVSTPDEVIEFQGRMRATHRDNVLRTEELANSELLDDLKARHQQRREQLSGRHAREMDAEQKDHERTQVHRTAEVVGTDPFAVLTLAYTSGEIDAKEFADRAAAIREQEIAQDRDDMRDRIQYDRQQELRRWEAQREDLRQESEARRLAIEEERRELAARNDFDRERRRKQWDADRQELTARTDFDRERERRYWEAEREDRTAHGEIERERERRRYDAEREDIRHLQEMERRRELDGVEAQREFDRERQRVQWEAERTDRLQEAEWAREDRRLERETDFKEVEAKLEVLRELAKHGQLDMLNLRLDKFVNDMLGQRRTPSIESETPDEKPAITASDDDEAADDDGDFEDEERNTKVEA